MPSVRRHGLSLFGLGLWMLAAAGGQWLELHVAVGHADHASPHPEVTGIAELLHHHGSESAADHEHDPSVKVDDPSSPSPRIHTAPSALSAILAVAAHPAARATRNLSTPDPHPRGTPTRAPSLQVLRI